jgi:hypothetical protein
MNQSAISFMAHKTKIEILRIQFAHKAIARSFCKDGCGCDAQRSSVTFYEAAWNIQFREFDAKVG